MKEKYKVINNERRKHFYKRIENVTNVTFTDLEMRLLNQGLKYNLRYK
jgi:hypothetical protein